jgi:hypothetical protein
MHSGTDFGVYFVLKTRRFLRSPQVFSVFQNGINGIATQKYTLVGTDGQTNGRTDELAESTCGENSFV